MFDIGISEIMVIAVVALVVIGPERLPRVARTIGTLLGRAQRYVNDVKAEVNREMELEELRKLQTQMQDAARDIQQTVSSAGADVQSAVHDVEKSLNETIAPVTEAAASVASADSATANVALTELTPLSEPPGTPASAVPMPAAGFGELAEPPVDTAPPAPPPQLATELATELPPESPVPQPAQAALFPEHTVR